ncbi:MAG TPA: hypothetical protein VFI29_10275, partial [Hanamia sp.]|nr:hypothetical protein [Hanamia sp.]
MKTLLVLALIILGYTVKAQPIANAGPDQTIYLTQTNSVTLNGSASSGDSYQWTDISANIGYPMLMNLGVEGHPTNTGSITSPTSATTTVTGLSQGVWYYQIAVTTSGSTKYDTMMVNVDYAPPPGTFINGLEFTNPIIYNYINSRTDTTQLTGGPDGVNVNGLYYFFDRARSNSMYVDAMKGKFYSVLEDGYGWQSTPTSYARVEGSYGTGYSLDTNKTYCFEWKGYFPQAFDFIQDNQDLVGFMQVHANDGSTGTFGLSLLNGYVGGDHSRGAAGVQGFYATIGGSYTFLANLSSFVNTTHTIRWTFREGAAYPGQDAFLKIEIDGVQKYFINNRKIGGTLGEDYPKWATLYDYGNALVDPNNHTRNKKFAMVTERFSIYDVSGGSNQSPTANAGSNQTITLPTNSVSLSGSGSDADGTISSYLWSKISGPSQGTISNPNSSSTNVSGLVQGVYQFQLTVTDNKGATGKSTMQVTVNSSSNQPPTANAGANQSITLPTNSISLSGSGNDPDGTISSYLWTKISGPSSYTIANPSSATTNVSDLVKGSYTFQLKVTDNNGATGTDTVLVTVNSSNQPPSANAGANQSITLPTNTVNLSGSGSDADGT